MNIQLEPGKYIVAVSGGVDSVSLLHALRSASDVELIVAHFDHGIRPNSAADREFVALLAQQYGLPFVYDEGQLGPSANEAVARKARYEFLERAREKYGAQAIITAHHQDDVLETAIINILRGTGRKGLSSLTNQLARKRPLLAIPKSDILAYARKQQLAWREDSTNADERYLRNYVRRQIVSRLDASARESLLKLINKSHQNNDEIDTLLVKYLSVTDVKKLSRQQVSAAPYTVATEIMATWLRAAGVRDFDSKTLHRLVIGAKTAQVGSQFDVLHAVNLRVGRDDLALVGVER